MNKKVDKDSLFVVYRNLLNRVAECHQYDKWNGDFVKSEINRDFDALKKWIGEIDLNTITEEQAKLLGFGKWDKSGLMLIPLYLFDCIKDGSVVQSISGTQHVWGVDKIDNDAEFGFIAYGFRPVKKSSKEKSAVKQ